MRTLSCSVLLSATLLFTTSALAIDISAINEAKPLSGEDKPAMIRLQTLLDRAGASVGPIDGLMGDATTGAIAAFEEMQGFEVDGKLDEKIWSALSSEGKAAVQEYEITKEDAGMELTGEIPERYAEMAKLEKMGFQRHSEALAERFHVTEELLKELNPDADFGKAGTKIIVPAPGEPVSDSVARIVIDKSERRVSAYSGSGEEAKLVFSAPAAVGSNEMPSPSGTMKVKAVAPEPNYTFDPENIPEAETKEKVIIPPGPNGPVGGTWIDLAKPTYGIHGTPEPSSIFDAQSHGCVRLTNWDVAALAKLVQAGETSVEFTE